MVGLFPDEFLDHNEGQTSMLLLACNWLSLRQLSYAKNLDMLMTDR